MLGLPSLCQVSSAPPTGLTSIILSRLDPCSVDFVPETPKFWFENCHGFLGGFFPPVFSKEKGPKKSTKKSTAKFTREFGRRNSPRISAEAFSWNLGGRRLAWHKRLKSSGTKRGIQKRGSHEKVKSPQFEGILYRTRSTTTRDRNLQFRGAVSSGGSPLDFFAFSPVFMCNLVRTSSLKSGESSEKSSGENRVKSCHVCGCHGFFGPDLYSSF